jgi:hypothetical protein
MSTRDVRTDAARAFARRLAHEAHADRTTPPDSLARELLVLLDSHQIGLTDKRRPSNPDTNPLTRPQPAPPDSAGRAAFEAAKAQLAKDST